MNVFLIPLIPLILGTATVYNNTQIGEKTSNGEIISRGKFTASHMVLPYNSVIEIKNIKNKRTMIVRVNDKCKYNNNYMVVTEVVYNNLADLKDKEIRIQLKILKIGKQ